jgi:hypothetical protein
MGFNTTANTITLTAKLTPIGRQRLVSTNNALISSFSLGDSDANYNVPLTLTTGQIPAEAGEIGSNASVSNSTTVNAAIKSKLIINSSGLLSKPVETQSTLISIQQMSNGSTSVSGSNLSQVVIDRNDYNTDSLVNLFYSFGLPLNSTQDYTYTGLTYGNGGYSDTTLSGLAQSKIIVLGIKNTTYGECLDGKTIKLELPTSATTYNIYSTFQNKGTSPSVEDANIIETSVVTSGIDANIALLFSDSIMTPNGGSGSLSWATGYNTTRPFSNNAKQFYNLQTDSNLGLSADTMVGIAYLDKGFIVITHPQIVADYDSITAAAAVVTFDSVSTAVFQNITCIAGRGEFGGSTNPTFEASDVPRISEIGLYDNLGNLIAMGKTDRHVTKNVNEFKAFNVKITL